MFERVMCLLVFGQPQIGIVSCVLLLHEQHQNGSGEVSPHDELDEQEGYLKTTPVHYQNESLEFFVPMRPPAVNLSISALRTITEDFEDRTNLRIHLTS